MYITAKDIFPQLKTKFLSKSITFLLAISCLGGIKATFPDSVRAEPLEPLLAVKSKQEAEITAFSGLPIVFTLTFKVKPNQREEFLKLASGNIEAAQKESGILSYGIYEEKTQKNSFLLFAELKSRKSLNAHLKTSYAKIFFRKLPEMVEDDPSTRVYTIKGNDFVLGM